jgi:hypothetical protein
MWEDFQARVAPGGKALYIFEGTQPVGIGTRGANGRPELFPLISGRAADRFRASFARFERAHGAGASPLSPRSTATGNSRLPSIPAGPAVRFAADECEVVLVDGTSVRFLHRSLEVKMPTTVADTSETAIRFESPLEGGRVAVILNGQSLTMPRNGPVWDGIGDLVLKLALGRAAQAAQLARAAPTPAARRYDYLAVVANIAGNLR